MQRKELIKAGETVDNYFKEVDGALEHQKEVLTTSPVKAARAKMDAKLAGLKGELEAHLADPAMRQDPAKLAALFRKQAELMRSFVGTAETPTKAAQELSRLGEGGLVTKARTAASKLEQRAARAEAQGINQHQAELGEAMRRQGQLRQQLHAARQRGDQAEAARLRQERQRFEAEMKSRNTMAAAGQKSQDAAEAARRKTAEHELKQRQAAAYRTASYQAADEQMADFLAGGGRVKSRTLANQIRPGSPERVVAERTMPSGEIERMTVSYGKAEATVARLTKAQSEARKEGGYLAADFLKNTAKVTLWAASVGVLYKSLELVTTSMEKLIAVGPQVGRLEQVFKGVGGTAQALTVDIMGLASANGAEVSQAMEAAIQWSRLGLNRVQVNEAVRVSLMAANVAQIDALEATEALQGVMQAYGMQVGELRGELGQMVQISNTYNVTNKDMLTGLSRCAAVAKQAGLPLAELQGLLGATIGGTAQTGANIGNMMKSVMLALSNPELQSKLRLNFKFEPTTGGEEIKGMSQMLGDVFVKFNQLNQLQRQSFLFTTAGRTQASRLEAMLEGYIKAQYLAINAQLHLNTAEAENEKIVGALRTQLKGLSAEWERFVFIQGSNGPVEAMGQLSTAVRNVLKVMNTPLGSVATTMIGGFLAAGGMKAVLTGMTLKGKDSFMTRSGAAIGGVLSNFNTSLMAVYEASMGKGRTAAARPAVGLFNKVGRGLDIGTGKAAEKMFVWSEAMLRVGKSSMITSAGVRGMATAFGAVTRALGAGLIALEAWIVPIAIVTLGIGAFNVVMEKIGASSEAATAKLAGFNAEAERATAAANAYAEAGQALGTLQRAITPEQGFPGMGGAERERYLKQASQLAYNYEPDETKRGRLQEAFGQQLLALNAQNDALGIQRMLQGEITINGQKRLEQLREAAVALEDRRRADQSEIARLTRLNNNSWVGGMFHDSRSQKIRELQKDESEASMARVRNIVDQGDTYEQAFAYSEKWNAELETQRLLWESIAEIFQSVKSNDPMVQSRMKIGALEAESEAMTRYIAILDQQEQADTEGVAKRELAKRANAQAIQDKAGEISAMQEWARKAGVSEANPTKTTYDAWHQPNWGGGGGIEVTYPGEALAKLKGELDLLQQQAPTVEGQADPEWAARQHARQQVREQQKKAEQDAEAQRRNSPIMMARRAIQFGEAEGQRESSPWEIGRDETAKLLNKREGILHRLNELSRLPQDDAVRLSRELALQNQLYETQGALRRRSFDTERDIRQLIVDQRREMEHALLGSGPAELLRKMAAIRMGAGGQMGIGQFMGMSPEMRREVAMVDPRFDPRMMDLQREARRQGRPGAAEFGQEQGRAADRLAELGERLNRVVSQADPEGRAAYNAAAKTMNVTAGTVNVTAPTVIFKGTLIVNGQGAAAPAAGGAAPRLAQAGGRGAGVGH